MRGRGGAYKTMIRACAKIRKGLLIRGTASIVRPFVRSFVRPFVRSFVRSIVRPFVRSIVRPFVPSIVRPFVPLFRPPSISSTVFAVVPSGAFDTIRHN